MRTRRPRPWQLALLSGVIALLALAAVNTASQTAAMPPGQPEASQRNATPRASSQDQRRANARQNTERFLAAESANQEHSRGRSHRVLISFSKGLAAPVALGELRKLAPEATPVVVTLALYDSTGQRHTQGILIEAGDDPEQKVKEVGQTLTDQTKAKAATMLNCQGRPGENCTPAGERAKANLVAHTQLDASQALVYGISVSGSVDAIRRLHGASGRPDQAIGFVEVVPEQSKGGVFLSPIWPK